jgi:hypothetical protein
MHFVINKIIEPSENKVPSRQHLKTDATDDRKR